MKKVLLILFFLVCSINVFADKIKYVFLFIGDGMSASSEFALSNFLYGTGKSLFWNSFPVQTVVTTWSRDSYDGIYNKNNFDGEKGYNSELAGTVPYPYYRTEISEKYFENSVPTDSAAAATAMSTGQKVNNMAVCYDEETDKFISNIVDKINEKKEYNVALITTDYFYSATPAGFSSHNKNRENYKKIAAEILSKTKPEIVTGKNEFYEMNNFASQNGYYLLDFPEINKPQVFDLTNKKIFLNLNKYRTPQPKESLDFGSFDYAATDTKFSDVVLYLTKILLKKNKPFFTLAEVCDIDHANHDNDYNGMLGGMYELNETVKKVCDLINSKTTDMSFDNTLIIVTADHSTGMLRFRRKLHKGQLPTTHMTKKNNITIMTNRYINYKTEGHVNELVNCYCIGAKADIFNKYINEKNIIDNTNIYDVLNDIIIKQNYTDF